MHAGLFDARPRSRELVWIMLAQRAARALQLGDDFTLRRFFDEFFATGVIPLPLTRWEMTGSAPGCWIRER